MKYITRTMQTTEVTYQQVLNNGGKPDFGEVRKVTLPDFKAKDTADCMRQMRKYKLIGKDEIVFISDYTTTEAVYGVTPEQFMSMAKVINRPASQSKKA